MKDKKDIFNGKIIEYEIGRVKFTIIYTSTSISYRTYFPLDCYNN